MSHAISPVLVGEMENPALVERVAKTVEQFCGWLDRYGETSWDHQSFFAGKLGRGAKALYYRQPMLGTLAVAPMVFFEALVPSARRLFYKPQRFPIADAHYAMGFALLAEIYGSDKYYQRAVHFLEVLQETRSQGYENYGWGYPFDWQTRTGTIKEGTPLITTVPYVYEAFSLVYAIDRDEKWLRIMQSIAEHALKDYRDLELQSDTASSAYTPAPDDACCVVNASAYRAFVLTKAGVELSQPRYLEVAKRNLNFVLGCQNSSGSWYYSTDGQRDFVDHFHTCFVLKALAKIEELTGCPRCRTAIERGTSYYLSNLFDAEGLPLPFSKAPRLTVYRRELYDYAECINLAVLLGGRFPELDRVLSRVVTDLLDRWRKADGSFRARELMIGWDNVPMHRWAQSQVFRSLCLLLSRNQRTLQNSIPNSTLQAVESQATS
jgi:Prenyltransferase and squalene oxidase repeat